MAILLLAAGCASRPLPPQPAPPALPVQRSALPPPEAPPARPPPASALDWPVRGPILSGFGVARGRRRHEGIDIKTPGGTIVRAAAAGLVSESRWRRGYGNVVTVDHGDGLETIYAHLAEAWVRVGARVARGEPIATVGATGNATAPHLHFEVRRAGRARNPLAWMPSGASESASASADLP